MSITCARKHGGIKENIGSKRSKCSLNDIGKASKQVWGIAHIGKFVACRLFSSVSCTCVYVHAVATSSRGRVAVVGPSCVAVDADGAAE